MTMQNYGLVFHHFGLAVQNISVAIKLLNGLGYECGEEIHDPLQEVILVWCSHNAMPAIELVGSTELPGPLDNILKHNSESIYHICYSSSNIDASIGAIKADGIRVLLVVEPKPAVLFGGCPVGFYQLRGLGLIEIVEES